MESGGDREESAGRPAPEARGSAASEPVAGLKAQLQRRAAEFDIVRSISKEINTSLDLEETFRTVMGILDDLLGFSHSMILLRDADSAELIVHASRGYPEAGIGARVPVGRGVIGVVAKHRRLMRTNALAAQSRYMRLVAGSLQRDVPVLPLPGLRDAKSQMALPLLVKGDLIGVYSVESASLGAFDELDEGILEVVANQVAGAIANARAYREVEELKDGLERRVDERTAKLQAALCAEEQQRQETEAARREIQKLAEFSRQMNDTTSLHEISGDMFRFLEQEFGLRRCGLFLVDSADNRVRFVAWHDADPASRPKAAAFAASFQPKMGPEAGMLYRTAQRGRPLYLRTIPPDVPNPTDRAVLDLLQMKRLLHVPLVVGGTTVGIIGAEPARHLRPAEIRSISRFCDQMAGAVNASHLIQSLEIERMRAEMARTETEKLARFAKRINETTDLESILDEVFAYLATAFGAQETVLQLVDRERRELRTVRAAGSDNEHYYDFVTRLRVPLDERGGTLYRTYVRQRPFYAPQIRGYPSELDREIALTLNLRSLAQFPLVIQERTIGILWISFGAQRKSLAQVASIARFCDQIAGAVSTSNLVREIELQRSRAEEARRESTQLAEISRRLNETGNLEEITAEVFGILHNEYGLRSVALLLEDRSAGDLYCHSVEHMTAEAARFWGDFRVPLAPESGTLWSTWQRQKPLYLPRIPKRMGSAVDRAIVESNELRHFLQLPLVVQGQTVGIVASDPGRHLRAEEVRLIGRFGDQVAGAVHEARLLNEAELARKKEAEIRAETELLAVLARKANEARDLDHILGAVAEVTQVRFGADSLLLVQAYPDRQRFEVRSFLRRGQPGSPEELPPRLRDFPMSPESGTAYRTQRKRRAMHLHRINHEWLARSPVDEAFVEFLAAKWLVQLPLISEGEVIAILAMSGPNERRLNAEERAFCERVAAQVAGAVRTTNLLEETRAARQESEKLAKISRQLNESTDIDQVGRTVVEFVRAEFSIEGVVLLLVDQAAGALVAAATTAPQFAGPEELRRARALRIPLESESLLVRVLRRGRPLYQRRAPRPGSIPEVDRAIVNTFALQESLAVPLVVRGEGFGLLLLSNRDAPLNLVTSKRRRLERYCAQIAGGVMATELLRQTTEARRAAERSRRDAELLADLSRRANESTDLDAILAVVAEIAGDRFGADSVAFFFVDRKEEQIRLRAWLRGGRPMELSGVPEQTREIPLVAESGTLYRVVQKKRALHIPRLDAAWLATSPVDAAINSVANFGWVVQLPLLVEGEVGAILGLSGSERRRRLDREEISFCERMAAQVAGVVRTLEFVRETQAARTESDRLLSNVLPARVADELKLNGHVEPLFYDAVTVLFTDFVGFTEAAQKLRPDELVEELDGCFSQFDAVVERNRLEKLKTIGDAYMCAAGLPVMNQTHAIDACLTALEFRAFMAQMAEVKMALGHDYWQIRIGIHSGPVTAGVIGANKFAYDIWGDTVNTASRMESSGEAGRVNISGATYELVKDFFECEHRGKVQAKGKGEMDMYFLVRIRRELSADSDGMLPNGRFEFMRAQVEDPFLRAPESAEVLNAIGVGPRGQMADREGW